MSHIKWTNWQTQYADVCYYKNAKVYICNYIPSFVLANKRYFLISVITSWFDWLIELAMEWDVKHLLFPANVCLELPIHVHIIGFLSILACLFIWRAKLLPDEIYIACTLYIVATTSYVCTLHCFLFILTNLYSWHAELPSLDAPKANSRRILTKFKRNAVNLKRYFILFISIDLRPSSYIR